MDFICWTICCVICFSVIAQANRTCNTNQFVCLPSKMGICSCSHSVVSVCGIRLYAIGIKPWLLHANRLTTSWPLERILSTKLLAVAQMWSLNAQQYLILTDTRACTAMQVSPSLRMLLCARKLRNESE